MIFKFLYDSYALIIFHLSIMLSKILDINFTKCIKFITLWRWKKSKEEPRSFIMIDLQLDSVIIKHFKILSHLHSTSFLFLILDHRFYLKTENSVLWWNYSCCCHWDAELLLPLPHYNNLLNISYVLFHMHHF